MPEKTVDARWRVSQIHSGATPVKPSLILMWFHRQVVSSRIFHLAHVPAQPVLLLKCGCWFPTVFCFVSRCWSREISMSLKLSHSCQLRIRNLSKTPKSNADQNDRIEQKFLYVCVSLCKYLINNQSRWWFIVLSNKFVHHVFILAQKKGDWMCQYLCNIAQLTQTDDSHHPRWISLLSESTDTNFPLYDVTHTPNICSLVQLWAAFTTSCQSSMMGWQWNGGVLVVYMSWHNKRLKNADKPFRVMWVIRLSLIMIPGC